MESSLLEDEIEIREKFNVKALYYKINYPEKKVQYDPIFKKWLKSQKIERGEKGKAFYCKDCKLFFYFKNEKEVQNAKENCSPTNIGYICEYCEEMIFDDSHCCLKGGIKNILHNYALDINFAGDDDNNFNFLLLIPPIFSIASFCIGTSLFFTRRRKSTIDDIFSYYLNEDSTTKNIYMIICLLVGFLLYFIFLVPNTILYIIYLVIILFFRNKS